MHNNNNNLSYETQRQIFPYLDKQLVILTLRKQQQKDVHSKNPSPLII